MPSEVCLSSLFFSKYKKIYYHSEFILKITRYSPSIILIKQANNQTKSFGLSFFSLSEGKTKSSFGFSFCIQTKTVVSFLCVTLLQCRSFNSSFLEFKLKINKNKRKDRFFFFSIYIQKKFCSFEILFFSAEENYSVHYQNYYFCIKQRLKQL